jgi:hypothetical protein
MSGGIAQLVAVGAQDAHLVGKPEVSFFRSTYKRHTNFALTVERQVVQGNPSNGGMSTIRFDRKGDLLSYVYLVKKNNNARVDFTTYGSTDISKVELLIGGQVIDELDSNSIELEHNTFCTTHAKRYGFGAISFLDLPFFFSKSWQHVLPLVSLQYHDVEVRITWNNPAANRRYEAWAGYIYLDNVEREWFANNTHDMLIVQHQKAVKSNNKIQELNFNHPIKALAATSNLVANEDSDNIVLQINGVDVGEKRTYTPHFSEVPDYYNGNLSGFPTVHFLIPFCTDKNKYNPTGSLNFSRLDSARLVTDASDGFDQVDIYALNYNILRIQNGMGGLMYSN